MRKQYIRPVAETDKMETMSMICDSQGVTSAEYGIFYGGVDSEGYNNPESRLRSLWDDESED